MSGDSERETRAKLAQDYDSDPPRCVTCVYHRHGPQDRYIERVVTTRRGKEKIIRFKQRPHPLKNPVVDRCTFGNFLVKPSGVCNEWRNRAGERIVEAGEDETD